LRIAFCTVIRDEADYLPEWLIFQRLIGFDAGIIYNNLSVDGTADILANFGRSQELITIDWPATDMFFQMRAYDDCIARFAKDFDWIAFIDIDEFIIKRNHKSLRDLLATQRSTTAGIAINWAMFGSSGHKETPQQLTIEAFTQRADRNFGPARLVKSIVRPGLTRQCTYPHTFDVDGDYVGPSGEPVEWGNPGRIANYPDYSDFSVNHYFTKSFQQWQKKLQRGYRTRKRSEDEFLYYDRNEIEDRSACTYADALRRELEKLGF